MRGWQPDDDDWSDIRRGFLSGAAAGLVVVAWMWLAHPGEESISSRGFDMGGGGFSGAPSSRPTGSSMIFAQHEPAPASVSTAAVPSSPQPIAGTAPAAPSAPQAPEAAAPVPAPAPAAVPKNESDPKELAKAGLPTDAKGLAGLGARQGMLSAVVEKFLAHPAVLKAVFNNKLVVDAFMNRDISKRNCSDAGALKSYLSDSQSAGMTKVFPVIQTVLNHPAAAGTLAGTEMAKRVMDCPSVKTLSNDQTAVSAIAVGNPQAMMLMADPRLTAALVSNPQASSLLSGLTGGGAQK